MDSLKCYTLRQDYINSQSGATMSESSYSLEEQSNSSVKRPYKRVTQQKKQELFREVFENKMKITKAARKIQLNISTAKLLIKQYKKTQPDPAKQRVIDRTNITISQSNNSTEEENGPQTETIPAYNHYLPFYYPFLLQEMYPCMPRELHPGFNLFYQSS